MTDLSPYLRQPPYWDVWVLMVRRDWCQRTMWSLHFQHTYPRCRDLPYERRAVNPALRYKDVEPDRRRRKRK